jgi:hypothetical protein
VAVDARAAFPPRPGETVGALVARAGGTVLGRVPLIVPVVPPPPASEGPWWLRAGIAVGAAVADAIHGMAD